MIIAMPNKRDKIELIVQKLSECGLDQIIFWPSERSIIRDRNHKKEQRLHKITKEATEQSRGRKIPEIHFAPDIHEYLQDTKVIVFDKPGRQDKDPVPYEKHVPSSPFHVTGVVGPEGGLTQKDYQRFE